MKCDSRPYELSNDLSINQRLSGVIAVFRDYLISIDFKLSFESPDIVGSNPEFDGINLKQTECALDSEIHVKQ